MSNQYTDNAQRNQAIIEAYLNGESLKKVGSRFGLSAESIHKITNRAGVTRKQSKKRAVITDSMRKGVLEAYQYGQPTIEIATSYAISQATVENIVKAAGYDITRKHLSQELISVIIEGYANGKSTYEIGEEIGFSNVTVAKVLRQAGVAKRSPFRLSEEQQCQVAKDYQNGESSEAIAKRLNVSATSVLDAIKRNGVRIREVWPKKEQPIGQVFNPNYNPQDLPECKFSGIYKFTNKINGKVYVGQAQNIYQRYYRHREMRAKGLFTKALKKYGVGNFNFEVLERVNDLSKLNEREQYWMDLYQAYNIEKGYNLAKIAGGIRIIKRPDLTKRMKG